MLLKALHVFGAVLLLGNVITTGLWSHWAIRSRALGVGTFATGAILAADLWLTLSGGALLTISGLLMVLRSGLPWSTPWLQAGMAALAGATVIWLGLLLPLQVVMRRRALAGDVAGLTRAYWWWSGIGWLDTGVLGWGLWMMVSKGLPA